MNSKISSMTSFQAYAKGLNMPAKTKDLIHQGIQKERSALKPAVIISSTLGILGALTLLSQGKNLKGFIGDFLNNAKLDEKHGEPLSEIKDFNMFKLSSYKNLVKAAKYGPLDIITMATFAITGGATSGITLDKKNAKTKLKESVSQLVGNIIIPVSALTVSSTLADKTIGKTIFNKNITASNVKWVKIPMSIIGFAIGVLGGHKIANALNKALFNEKQVTKEREIKATDLMAHVDDIATTAGMMGKGISAYEGIARVIPAAVVIPGILAGFAGSKEPRAVIKKA